MPARPPEEKPEGAPEWMVSYADMITIMMSFFVIMFALSSKGDSSAKEAAKASLGYRFSPAWQPFGNLGAGLLPRGAKHKSSGGSRGRGAMYGTPPGGDADDPAAADSQPMRIRVPGRGDRLEVGGAVSFEEGSDELSQEQIAKLRAIVEEVAGKPQKVEVLGHASKRPLPSGSPYRDHWDLAYARCRRTVDRLVSLGIDPKRIRMGVAGSNEPVYLGESPEMMSANSRVDVYLINTLAEEAGPSAGKVE